MCKSIHMSKYLFTPLRSRGCPQRFARLSSSHSDVMLGVAKPFVLLHLSACKSNKHQMQTASKTLKHCYLGFLAKSTAICRVLSDMHAVDSQNVQECSLDLGKISIVWQFLRLLRRSQNMARCQDVSTMQVKRTAFISSNLNSPQMP